MPRLVPCHCCECGCVALAVCHTCEQRQLEHVLRRQVEAEKNPIISAAYGVLAAAYAAEVARLDSLDETDRLGDYWVDGYSL